jgi:hypothetical protein
MLGARIRSCDSWGFNCSEMVRVMLLLLCNKIRGNLHDIQDVLGIRLPQMKTEALHCQRPLMVGKSTK